MQRTTLDYMKKTIQTKLDKEDIRKLSEEAKKKGHTLSSFIRHLVKKFLETVYGE